MKLVLAGPERFVFHLRPKEREILLLVLNEYPLVPLAHYQLSKHEERAESRQLMDEVLEAQRRESKNLVESLVRSGALFRQEEDGWRFSLKDSQMEWMLQVLNDVRVGSWLILGSPEGDPTELNEKTGRYFFFMQMAGGFQGVLLAALATSGPEAEAKE